MPEMYNLINPATRVRTSSGVIDSQPRDVILLPLKGYLLDQKQEQRSRIRWTKGPGRIAFETRAGIQHDRVSTDSHLGGNLGIAFAIC